MSRFAAMKSNTANAPIPAPAPQTGATQQQANRVGRKIISGYFSEEMHVSMKVTAAKAGVTMQQAMAEAFDLWLREKGESPIGG